LYFITAATPAAKEEVAEKAEATPAATQEVAEKVDDVSQAPVAKEEVAEKAEATPATKEEVAEKVEATPAAKEEVAEKVEATPATKEEVAEKVEATPAAKEEVAEKADNVSQSSAAATIPKIAVEQEPSPFVSMCKLVVKVVNYSILFTGHPYQFECAKESDEFVGMQCADWAMAGYCETNKATKFLFCRKTCLCDGPPKHRLLT
jgi:hypothetical protein